MLGFARLKIMAENNKMNGDDKNTRKPGGGGRMQPSTIAVWIAIIGGMALLFSMRGKWGEPTRAEISQYDFVQKVNSNLIASAKVNYGQQSSLTEITGNFFETDASGEKTSVAGKPVEVPFRTKVVMTESFADQLRNVKQIEPRESSALLFNIGINVLFLALFVFLIWFFFIRPIRMAGKGALSFGKSKARLLAKERNKTTFKDVAGVEEAIEEVSELVEFLKDPKKFQRLGGRIPKGILMIGSPGTGKTLLAKAIAGEADAAFFSISGSDFVEMFVGVGASRVRDMFEQARKNTPCLIFIDEIDAVGRSRGHGLGGGNDEREQTLNALLVEMDGFDTQEGIIIIAATNRPDVLDPALLRPGRFDRQITVNLPDVRGREGILKVHAKKVKMAADVDLMIIARGTPGYSGAELANVI